MQTTLCPLCLCGEISRPEALTNQVQAKRDISDGDVLQALSMTLAVRARMVDASPESTLILVQGLVEKAYQAAQQAASYAAVCA